MRHTRLIVALLIAGFAAGIHIGDANASSFAVTETTREAYATFDLHEHGLRTSVDITVAESETKSAEGSERGLHADIEVLQFDTRGRHSRMIDVAGSVETQPGAFTLEDDLSAGHLEITIPVCGARPNHNGRLKERSFSDCFDVSVSLEWKGNGEMTSENGAADYRVDDCVVHTESGYDRRVASATGTVLVGSLNVAAGTSVSSAMSDSTHTTTVTCPA